MIATAAPAAATSPGGGTAPTHTGDAIKENNVNGGGGWSGANVITVMLGYEIRYLDATWASLTFPSTWLLTVKHLSGAVVATRTGNANASHTAPVSHTEYIPMTAVGTYTVSYLLTAQSVTVGSSVDKLDGKVSTAPVVATISSLSW